MMNKLGQKNLFICLNDKVSALPLVHFVESLKAMDGNKECVVLVDEKQKESFNNFESESLVFLSKESFASSSPFSSQILCHMKSIDQQMKKIEEMGFDKVFQLGPIQWGRWMLSDLNQKVVRFPVDESLKTTTYEVTSMLHSFFGVTPEMRDLSEQPVLLHPYSNNEIDWHFLATLKTVDNVKFPWVQLAVHEDDLRAVAEAEGNFKTQSYRKKEDLVHCDGLLVSFDSEMGSFSSLEGKASGWITEAADRKDFEAFCPNSFMMTMDSEDFNPQEFMTALNYWRAGRLSELAFLNIQSHFQIESLQLIGERLSLSSVSQNFEEYHFIKKVLSTYREVSLDGDQSKVADRVLENLFSQRFEKYLFYAGIRSLKYVVETMIVANRRGERAFKKFSNDFYKISIADEIFENTLVGNEGKTEIFNKLNKLLNFLQTLEYSGESVIESSLEIS